MTQTITDKDRQPAILDMARVNSRLIAIKSKYKVVIEDVEILKKKLLPYYRDKKRFEERMEQKYNLTKTLEKLQEKMTEKTDFEKEMHLAGTMIILNYLNQYYEMHLRDHLDYYQNDGIQDKEKAQKYAHQKLLKLISILPNSGIFVSWERQQIGWENLYEFCKDEGNLSLSYGKYFPEGNRDKAKNIISFQDNDMGVDFSLSEKAIEEFNILVMKVVEETLSLKRQREEEKKAKDLSAREARLQLYYRLKQEFEPGE